MKEYKSIVSSTWVEFVKELQSTAKEGKQIVQRLEYQHSFFKAVLVQGYCPSFVSALSELTGAEVDCLECIDNLLKAVNVKAEVKQNVLWAEDNVVPPTTVESLQDKPETKQDIDVEIVKPKTTRKRKTNKGE